MAYAIAGLASAAGGAVPAEGAIHYSGRIFRQLQDGDILLPLSGGASLLFQRNPTSGGYYDYMWVTPAVDEGVATNPSSGFLLALKFPRRVNVSTAGHFQGFGQLVNGSLSGNFLPKGQGMAAFMFDTGKGPQYGWARIRTTVGGPDNQMEVVDYAWADPGEPILTGQKKEGVEPAPETTASGSLGLLALGSAGLLAWRECRQREEEES